MKLKSRKNRGRDGMTLIEVMIFVALGSVVLGTIGLMLNGIWRVQRSMSDYRTASNAIGQFAEQLRSDVHSAANVRIVSATSNASVQIDLSDNKQVEYRAEKLGIERVVTNANVVQRESYYLPAGSTVEWSISAFEQGKLLTAFLKYPLNHVDKSETADRREFKIEAAIPAPSPSQGEAGRG